MEQVLQEQHEERERHVIRTLSTLKSIADAAEGRNPRAALERALAKGIAVGIRNVRLPSDQIKEAASRRNLEAISLAAIAEREVGPSFVEYDPETFLDMGFTHHEAAKLLAAKLVLYDARPFEEWHVFEKVAIAFNDREIQFDLTQDLAVHELAWAVDAMRFIDPQTPFSEEVAAYVAANAREEGFVVLPTALAFAQGCLDRVISDQGRMVARKVNNGSRDPEAVIQRERLAAVNQYVNTKHRKLQGELRTLT